MSARLSTDPGILAEQFDRIQPAENGPQSVLRAWSDLNAWFSPNRARRIAALAVFSDTDALTWHGTARDRAGRSGIKTHLPGPVRRRHIAYDRQTRC